MPGGGADTGAGPPLAPGSATAPNQSPGADACPRPRPVRVLVIDDSALMRRLMRELLEADPEIEVVGTAADPYIARGKIKQLAPDVLTMDVEMPRMDGLTFLRNLMRLRPMPVVMVSTLTRAGAQVTLDALALGAVDFIPKPSLDASGGMAAYADELAGKLKTAARARVIRHCPSANAGGAGAAMAGLATGGDATVRSAATDGLLAIGASLGGTEAIREVLGGLPSDAPATVIAQHIPAAFSSAFAERLDRHSRMTVREARDGEPLLSGHAYLAPGGFHLRIAGRAPNWHCRVDAQAPVRGHRPSVDVLFESVAAHAGAKARAILLTGMGDDGARGLLALRRAGARTLAQDQATSVVWGMPRAAVEMGAAMQVVPLGEVARSLLAAAGPGAPMRST